MATMIVRILGFFGTEFHKENLHFRGWNFTEWLNLVQGFISIDKKIILFWGDLLRYWKEKVSLCIVTKKFP